MKVAPTRRPSARDYKGDQMTSGKRLAFAIGIGLITTFASLSAAEAQYGYPPPPPGPAASTAAASCSAARSVSASSTGPTASASCGGAFMVEGHIGGMLNPRLALMGTAGSARATSTTPLIGTGSTYNRFWTFNAAVLGDRHHLAQGRHRVRSICRSTSITTRSTSRVRRRERAARSWARRASRSCSRTTGRSICRSARATPSTDGGDLNNLAFMVGINWY